jgi:hypothetical protein
MCYDRNKEVNGIDGLPTLSTGMEMVLFKVRSLDVPDFDYHEPLSGPS